MKTQTVPKITEEDLAAFDTSFEWFSRIMLKALSECAQEAHVKQKANWQTLKKKYIIQIV